MERTRTSGSADPAGWRVRVLDDGGTRVAGAGVLLPSGSVLTCAHVVETALGTGRSPGPPDGTVLLEFLSAAPGDRVRAHAAADGWLRTPPAGDLAVLHPAGTVPHGAAPAPVDATGVPDGTEVLVHGHPVQAPDGVWARARTVGAGGPQPRWWQLDGADHMGARIEPGFSGGGVWDPERGRVIGVVAAALEPEYGTFSDMSTRVAWMIPLALLDGTPYALTGAGAGAGAGTATGTEAFAGVGVGADAGASGAAGETAASLPAAVPAPTPAPAAPVAPPADPPATPSASSSVSSAPTAPPPGRAPLWEVVEALLAVSVAEADGGTELIALLPDRIRRGVRRADRPRMQAFHLVQRCGDFADGPAALVRVVRQVEGDTLPVRQFVARAEQLWPDRLAGP